MLCVAESGQPATFDFVLPAGSTLARRFVWKTGDPATAVNLTGYTARMIMSAPDQTAVELSTANGRIALGGVAGTIDLHLPAAISAELAAGTWEYSLDLTAGTTVRRLLGGFIPVTA